MTLFLKPGNVFLRHFHGGVFATFATFYAFHTQNHPTLQCALSRVLLTLIKISYPTQKEQESQIFPDNPPIYEKKIQKFRKLETFMSRQSRQ